MTQTEEGCLSVPQVYELVERAERVRVRAQDRTASPSSATWRDCLPCACSTRWITSKDELFVDYLSSLKRERIRRKLVKEQRERGEAPRPRVDSTRLAANAKVI